MSPEKNSSDAAGGKQAESVMDLGAPVIFSEQRAVMAHCVVEIAGALVIEREPEVVGRRLRRRWR